MNTLSSQLGFGLGLFADPSRTSAAGLQPGAPSANRTSPPNDRTSDRFDGKRGFGALSLPASYSPAALQKPSDALNPKQSGSGKQEKDPAKTDEESVVADRFIRGYLDFLITFSPTTDPQAQLQQADKLLHAVADPLGINPDDIQSFDISSETSFSAAYAAATGVDEDGNQTSVVAAGADFQSHLRATIVTKDGTRYEVELDIQASVRAAAAVTTNQADPLVLDLNGDGVFSLTDISNGTGFDLDGDGQIDQSAFAFGPDAFLALDRNGNGNIDDGHELFGDQNGDANGFEALNQFDTDQNGEIDRYDSVYSLLRGVRIGQDGSLEQFSLEELGVRSLNLSYTNTDEAAEGGNRITQRGTYQTLDNQFRGLGDALLGFHTLSKDA